MKTIKKRLGFLTLLIAVLFTSCNNEEVITQEPKKDLSSVTKNYVKKVTELDVPQTFKDTPNSNAQQANAYFNMLKSQAVTMVGLFNVPNNATKLTATNTGVGSLTGKSVSVSANTTTYTWTYGSTSVTYSITESSDRYNFKYLVKSPQFTGTLMDGYSLKDGSYFEMTMRGDSKNEKYTLKCWVNNNSSKIEVTSSEGIKLVATSNKDLSGTIDIYENNALSFQLKWNADGSGSGKNYLTGETFTW